VKIGKQALSVLFADRASLGFLALLAGVALVVPVLNVAVPESSPLHLSSYVVGLIGKYLCYAILATAVDLIWGFCGILSLGHAVFFALGGYAMGMYLMRQIGTRGVYGHPVLPDFMVFLNWDELPWFWYGFDHFWFALVMVALVPAALAFVFGWLAFRARVTGVYFSIMTQALSYALLLAFFRNDMGFGGNNGFTDFKDLLGFDLQSDSTRSALLVATAATLAASYGACRMIVASRAGRVIRSIRDAENRTRFLGYRVESYKLWLFVFSAVLAGVRWSSGCQWGGAAPCTERPPARYSSTTSRRTLPGRCPNSGCMRSARSSSVSRSFSRADWQALCGLRAESNDPTASWDA